MQGFKEEIRLQPGEWVKLAAKTVQNTAAFCIGDLNTREDQ